MLGWAKIFHQPAALMSAADMSDVMKSAKAGTSQSSPTTTSTRWTGALAATRSTFAPTLSLGAGISTGRSATDSARPPV